jgi:hypothetical protein
MHCRRQVQLKESSTDGLISCTRLVGLSETEGRLAHTACRKRAAAAPHAWFRSCILTVHTSVMSVSLILTPQSKVKQSRYTSWWRLGGGERKCSFYSFTTLALDGVSGQHHAPAALYPRGKDPRYPLDRSLRGPQSRSGHRG